MALTWNKKSPKSQGCVGYSLLGDDRDLMSPQGFCANTLNAVLPDYTQMKTINELVNHVPQGFKEDFLQFIETGEARKEFLDYMDRDDVIKEIVDRAFDIRVQDIQQIVKDVAEKWKLE